MNEEQKTICFWKPGISSSEKGCLSQFFTRPFKQFPYIYVSAEHYMMHRKAILFGDFESAYRIMSSTDPSHARSHGRGVKGFHQKMVPRNKLHQYCKLWDEKSSL